MQSALFKMFPFLSKTGKDPFDTSMNSEGAVWLVLTPEIAKQKNSDEERFAGLQGLNPLDSAESYYAFLSEKYPPVKGDNQPSKFDLANYLLAPFYAHMEVLGPIHTDERAVIHAVGFATDPSGLEEMETTFGPIEYYRRPDGNAMKVIFIFKGSRCVYELMAEPDSSFAQHQGSNNAPQPVMTLKISESVLLKEDRKLVRFTLRDLTSDAAERNLGGK